MTGAPTLLTFCLILGCTTIRLCSRSGFQASCSATRKNSSSVTASSRLGSARTSVNPLKVGGLFVIPEPPLFVCGLSDSYSLSGFRSSSK
ncbi:hypothetical protein PF005_g4221 [Phytophthora fragariae]|uniref:Secreted protein n=1 Tax=Phytophthora fragariae TaxID=53985 RepID=A0A6A3FIV3_9STRA|nr:hypothetical protein PF003_g23434 [Phytophthora fragariae]KAE8945715.1 hypothetical protein PF009_g4643 [Phytophthora fragariae]KAE8974630.1 hypothetical protein PF011_g24790 [Phytophthora fragariae]KAE9089760.1 hypothetical protein PF006_g25288 [Phytophthora fragariae]KAE9133704.1 hypothetical protein PF007_g3229 [Phytophthora fragariae]